MCLYPRGIPNPKYTKTKKNRGIIPPVYDQRVLYVPIGCNKCMECRKQKARSWNVRLLEDLKKHKNGKFITLKFSNQAIQHLNTLSITRKDKKTGEKLNIKISKLEGYEKDNAIATIAMRQFLERWRRKYKTSIRHWFVTELGHNGTENIHMHGIFWTDKPSSEIENIWNSGKVPNGFIWKGYYKNGKLINYVNEATVGYTTKYVSKMDMKHKEYNSIVLCSKGIGRNYTEGRGDWTQNKYQGKETQESYRTRTGHKIALPIYWRNKIYTDEEREKLWLHKLDKQERWINGTRIDISQGEENYYKALEHHRQLNKELGYGDDKKNWRRIKYEHERRILITNERLQYTFSRRC